ncbi:MAG: AAA family ATPase, partial [Deltaproteobacteria bacterium]|nr:AAA family ATPase [Deltaproteobacteria bacterium]
MDLNTVRELAARLREQVHRVVVGQDHAIDLLFVAMLCEGHILFEGVPGVAKTLLARTFASGLSLTFSRVQFTPDLMPGDIIGTNLFNFQTNTFTLTRGPIFTQLLLADEINRTPPKTQAALLQAMQERSVTVDGVTYELGDGFMVIATQNPIEQEGTYLLPEAQLDRFLFKVIVGYPTRDDERDIVRRHGHRTTMPRLSDFQLQPIADLGTLVAMRNAISQIRISDG